MLWCITPNIVLISRLEVRSGIKIRYSFVSETLRKLRCHSSTSGLLNSRGLRKNRLKQYTQPPPPSSSHNFSWFMSSVFFGAPLHLGPSVSIMRHFTFAKPCMLASLTPGEFKSIRLWYLDHHMDQ